MEIFPNRMWCGTLDNWHTDKVNEVRIPGKECLEGKGPSESKAEAVTQHYQPNG